MCPRSIVSSVFWCRSMGGAELCGRSMVASIFCGVLTSDGVDWLEPGRVRSGGTARAPGLEVERAGRDEKRFPTHEVRRLHRDGLMAGGRSRKNASSSSFHHGRHAGVAIGGRLRHHRQADMLERRILGERGVEGRRPRGLPADNLAKDHGQRPPGRAAGPRASGKARRPRCRCRSVRPTLSRSASTCSGDM